MKTTRFSLVRTLKAPQFWLLAIGANLIAIHLTLTHRGGNVSLLASSLLFWLAVSSLVWKKRHDLKLESGVFASFLGIAIVTAIMLKSVSRPTSNFLGVSPFVSALGLGLLASGFAGLKQYWRELIVLFFLGVPKVLIWPIIDISVLSAQLATFILWYTGFEVRRQKFDVMLPKGGVNVNMGCSGFEGIFYLLGLAVLFLVMFPLDGLKKKILVPIVAVFIAFFVNGFRIALMAILANDQNQEALKYWHVGDGSLIFSMISVGLFGLFCYFLLRQENSEAQEESETQENIKL
jgi:cyanoexosortase A